MTVRNKAKKYTKEQIEMAVRESISWGGVMKLLNPDASYKGSQSNIKKTAEKMGIDFSHFKGQSWSRGLVSLNRKPIEYYFSGGGCINSNNLKKRILEDGIKEWKCETCKNIKWLDEKIPLELHHKDHNPKNNQLDNLKLLCPNCHYKEHHNDKEKRKVINKEKHKGLTYKKLPRKNTCPSCGCPSVNKYCSYKCYNMKQRKVDRPTKEELESLIREKSFTEIGKIYNLCDNSIRKWAKQYGIDLSISKFKRKGRKARVGTAPD